MPEPDTIIVLQLASIFEEITMNVDQRKMTSLAFQILTAICAIWIVKWKIKMGSTHIPSLQTRTMTGLITSEI